MLYESLIIICVMLLTPVIMLIGCICNSTANVYTGGDDGRRGHGDNNNSRRFKALNSIAADVTNMMSGKELKPIYSYGEVPSAKYIPTELSGCSNLNCHHGQRKLLMNEILFITTCCKNIKLIVYAGSAPNSKLLILMKLFPDKKFLCIDPNYHEVAYQYTYVYQNTSSIDKKLWVVNKKLRATSNRPYMQKIQSMTTNTPFYKTNAKYDIYDINTLTGKMSEIMDDFYSLKYKSLIRDIIDGDCRVYIIQDLLTRKLSETLAKSLSQTPEPIGFISDIRTNLFRSYPTELDYVWNDAMQMIFLNILRPTYSMLKFRPPYFVPDMWITTHYNNPPDNLRDIYNIIKADLDYVKSTYNFDPISNYRNNKYMYLKSSIIHLQPWAGLRCTEARLIISKADVTSPHVLYDHTAWDNKYMYMRSVRSYGYYGGFYEHIKHIPDPGHSDGCFDCTLDLIIITNYMMHKNGKNNIDSPVVNVPELIKYISIGVNQHDIVNMRKDIRSNMLYDTSDKCGEFSYITKPLINPRIYYVTVSPDKNTIYLNMMHNHNGKTTHNTVATYSRKSRKANIINRRIHMADNAYFDIPTGSKNETRIIKQMTSNVSKHVIYNIKPQC